MREATACWGVVGRGLLVALIPSLLRRARADTEGKDPMAREQRCKCKAE